MYYCEDCVHFDGSQHNDGYGYCDVQEEIVHEEDGCEYWEQ